MCNMLVENAQIWHPRENESEIHKKKCPFLSNCKHLFYFIPHVFCCKSLGVSRYHKERALWDVNCIIFLCCNCKSYRRQFFGSPAFKNYCNTDFLEDSNFYVQLWKNSLPSLSFSFSFLFCFHFIFFSNKKMKLTCGARVRLGLHLPF